MGCNTPDAGADADSGGNSCISVAGGGLEPWLDLLYQASPINGVDQFDTSTVKAISVGPYTPSVDGNPAVIGGVPYEAGRHWLLVRGGSAVYLAESYDDEELMPN